MLGEGVAFEVMVDAFEPLLGLLLELAARLGKRYEGLYGSFTRNNISCCRYV